MGAILGGSVRVGLEDSIYLAKGQLAEANADQVAKIARILRELSLEIATPDEARQMLALKGADRTGIPTKTLPRPAGSAGTSLASADHEPLT